MENWGLITGRTTAFLYDPAKSSLSAKKRVAVVQSHEVRYFFDYERMYHVLTTLLIYL